MGSLSDIWGRMGWGRDAGATRAAAELARRRLIRPDAALRRLLAPAAEGVLAAVIYEASSGAGPAAVVSPFAFFDPDNAATCYAVVVMPWPRAGFESRVVDAAGPGVVPW